MADRVLAVRNSPDPFDSPAIERDHPDTPTRLSLRLGNRFYPHMKLSVGPLPDGRCAFRVDTHDRHCCPSAQSAEHAAFLKLMENNQAISAQIEAAWSQAGLPTFKRFLREDLARRRGHPPPQTAQDPPK